MANKQHGTRQKLVFRGSKRPVRPARPPAVPARRRDAEPPGPPGPAVRRQPRKLIGASDS
jgi:hypothetical protein